MVSMLICLVWLCFVMYWLVLPGYRLGMHTIPLAGDAERQLMNARLDRLSSLIYYQSTSIDFEVEIDL